MLANNLVILVGMALLTAAPFIAIYGGRVLAWLTEAEG